MRHEVREMHVGPLPPPKTLAEYDKIVPHLAENIVQWASSEQQHRHMMESQFLELEKQQVKASIFDGRLGQALGFIMALAGFATAGSFASLGHPWAGATIGGGTLVGIVWCFIFGSRVKASDSVQQMQQVMNLSNNGVQPNTMQPKAEETKAVSK